MVTPGIGPGPSAGIVALAFASVSNTTIEVPWCLSTFTHTPLTKPGAALIPGMICSLSIRALSSPSSTSTLTTAAHMECSHSLEVAGVSHEPPPARRAHGRRGRFSGYGSGDERLDPLFADHRRCRHRWRVWHRAGHHPRTGRSG